MKRIRIPIGLALVTCLMLITTACPKTEKDRNVAFARDLVGGMEAAGPIIATKSAELAQRWTTATTSARQLINAIDSSDATTAATLVRDILPVFSEVVRQFGDNQNLQIALALGQIALNFFVNHYLAPAKVAAGASAA